MSLGYRLGRIGHIAAGSLGLQRLGLDIVTADPDAARGGLQQPDDHLDGGGLPGAIGSQEAEDFPGLNREADVVDGGFSP